MDRAKKMNTNPTPALSWHRSISCSLYRPRYHHRGLKESRSSVNRQTKELGMPYILISNMTS